MKKTFTSLLFAITATNASANNCVINYLATKDIVEEIEKEGFKFEGFNNVCMKLKVHGAMISVNDISQITEYETTSAVHINLAMSDASGKKIGSYVTEKGINFIVTNSYRSTAEEKKTRYRATMYALEELNKNPKYFREMLNQLDQLRMVTRTPPHF